MPAFRRQATPEEAIGRYREALLRGAPADELERLARGLDPELVATERWLLTAGRRARPHPDPHFARDLRRMLVEAASTAEGAATPFRPPSQVWADRRQAVPPPRLPPAPPAAPAASPRWQSAQLAAAAALIILLVGSVLLVRQVTVERSQSQLGAIGEPTTETLLDAILTGAADAWTPLTIERWRFQPGATLTVPPLDGPQWIVADSGPLAVTVAGAGQSLPPGQGLVVPAGRELAVRNAGLAETALYRGVASLGFSLEEYDRSLVTKELALDTEAHESLPPGQSHVVFDRFTIPAGTTMQVDAATGQDWFAIATGQLGLTLVGDALPPGWTSGRERELGPDDLIPVLVPGTHITMRNAGHDPLVLLRLRITAQDATPDAAAG